MFRAGGQEGDTNLGPVMIPKAWVWVRSRRRGGIDGEESSQDRACVSKGLEVGETSANRESSAEEEERQERMFQKPKQNRVSRKRHDHSLRRFWKVQWGLATGFGSLGSLTHPQEQFQ